MRPGNGWNGHCCDLPRNIKADYARACAGLAEKRHKASCAYGIIHACFTCAPDGNIMLCAKARVAVRAS